MKTIKLLDLFSKGRKSSYRKGEIIIRPDDNPSGVFYIQKGYVRVYSITVDGDEKIHVIYKKDEVFPLLWALKDIQKDVYYEALSDLVLKRVPKDLFITFVKEDPTVLHELIDRLVSHFDVFVDRVGNLEISKAYPRLVAQLLFLSKRFGKKVGKGVVIQVPIAHKDIASSINMTRETASREFEKLEKKGLIGYRKHSIVIKNENALKKELLKHYEREPI